MSEHHFPIYKKMVKILCIENSRLSSFRKSILLCKKLFSAIIVSEILNFL